jgi:hypothetical protein
MLKLTLKQPDFLEGKIRVLKVFDFPHMGFKPRHWPPPVRCSFMGVPEIPGC